MNILTINKMSNKLLQKMFGIFQHFRNIVSSKHWVYVTYCLTPSHNTNQRTKHRLLICEIPSRISVMFYKTKKKGRFCHNRCTLCTLWYDTSIVDWVVYKNLCGFFFPTKSRHFSFCWKLAYMAIEFGRLSKHSNYGPT